MRCWACLILSKCYSLHLLLWLWARIQSVRYQFYLTIFDHWSSCTLKPSGYFIEINCAFTFSITNVFCFFCSIMAQFELVKHKFLNWITLHICLGHTELSNAQYDNAPTTTILLNAAGTYHGFNYFGALQTSTYKNIAKLLIHSLIFEVLLL